MIDASSVGMFEMYSKVQKKNRLIFYYEVEKKTKKQTHEHKLTFSLLILLFFVGRDDSRRCAALPLPAEDFPGH